MNKVKEPRKAKKAIEELRTLVEQLEFFYQDNPMFKKEVLERAIFIEKALYQLSVDKKVENAKFVSTFKEIFGKEVKELKEENKELKEELKERGKIIGELVEENKELTEIVVMSEGEDGE